MTEFQKEGLLEWFFNGSDLNIAIWVLLNPIREFPTLVFELPKHLAEVTQESQ